MSLEALSCNNPPSIYDFHKENINETIISIISDLNNDSSYDEIIQKYDQINIRIYFI